MGVNNSKKKILIYGLDSSRLLLLYTFYKHFYKYNLIFAHDNEHEIVKYKVFFENFKKYKTIEYLNIQSLIEKNIDILILFKNLHYTLYKQLIIHKKVFYFKRDKNIPDFIFSEKKLYILENNNASINCNSFFKLPSFILDKIFRDEFKNLFLSVKPNIFINGGITYSRIAAYENVNPLIKGNQFIAVKNILSLFNINIFQLNNDLEKKKIALKKAKLYFSTIFSTPNLNSEVKIVRCIRYGVETVYWDKCNTIQYVTLIYLALDYICPGIMEKLPMYE